MSYGLIYTVPFASLDNEACVVEIEKEGYSGKVTELIAGTSPFTVDIESEEFLYTPTRFSTATIRIVGNDYLQSLFTIAYQQYRVTFKKDEIITWCGFIKPELYTQDYSSETFELELECMSAMSSLEFIDYSQTGENRVFVSLWDLLKKCITASNNRYIEVYIPHVYGPDEIEYNSDNNVLEEMTISEQNFFDEDDKPMKLKEVLEEICKFLNWTCVDWKGELYFVDIDHLGEFRSHNPASFVWEGSSVTPESNNLQRIGFAGSDHSLDILPGFNKVTIKTSNYPIGELTGDEEFEDLETLQTPEDLHDGDRVCHQVYMNPNKTEMLHMLPERTSQGDVIYIDDLKSYKGDIGALFGAIPMKYCNYEMKKIDGKWMPSISDYSYTDVVRIRIKSYMGENAPTMPGGNGVYKIKGPCAIYSDGAISISGFLKVLYNNEMSPLKIDYPYLNRGASAVLRIGEYYYTGSDWKKGYATWGFSFQRDNFNEEWLSIKNKKTLDMPYEGAAGEIAPIASPIFGDFEFKLIYKPAYNLGFDEVGHLIRDFKVNFVKANWMNKSSNKNSDRIYENVINENYINELDEIEFKISSYNNDGACYSKVMLGEKYLTDNLYSDIEKTYIRPEEQLIRRIIKRYSAPRIKLTQVIKEPSDLTPISRLYDNYMVNKRFINVGGTIDYAMNQFQCIMIEV